MLKSLHVKNFALIAELDLDFYSGLNLITGETGAGKSILMDALGFVLGAKADNDCIRSGEEQAKVWAEFGLSKELSGRVQELLEAKGLPHLKGELSLKRELNSNGRGRAWVNDESCAVSLLGSLAGLLVDFHGQHEHQSLLKSTHYLDLLDRFAQTNREREETAAAYAKVQRLLEDQKAMNLSEQERARQLDLLQFQVKELEEARLREGEEAGLLQERSLLASAEKRSLAVHRAYEAFQGSEQGGALASLKEALQALKDLAHYDAAAQNMEKRLESLSLEVEDTAEEVGRYRDAIAFDPKRLEEIEERLALLAKLKKKYGSDETALLNFLVEAKRRLEALSGLEFEQSKIAKEIEAACKELSGLARALSQKRKQAAKKFSQAVTAQLKELGMEKAVFDAAVSWQESEAGPVSEGGKRYACGPQGMDQVEFMLSPNPGEVAKALGKIASGGELSRIMLAIKTVLFNLDPLETLIFDEVDSGISGRIAQVVGEKLSKLSVSRQVLCITHLAQIACQPCHHFKVRKEVRQQKTYTIIQELSVEERVREVAALVDGLSVTESGLAHARKLLNLA